MALNVPAGDAGNLTFGPGILYITSGYSISNGTPNIDIGYCRGSQFQVNRSKIDVHQGSPKARITTFASQEDLTLQVVGLEWNLDNLVYVLGAGAVSGTSFRFGGEVTFAEVGLHLRHITPNNGTVDIYVYRAQGSGENTFNFGDDIMEFTFNFTALETDCTWTNNALAVGQKLTRIDYVAGT
jgi:hypothetical protein